MHSACNAGAKIALDSFDQLLGCLALLVDVDRPPIITPRIILPGQEETHAQTELLRQQNRTFEWDRLKQELIKIIEEIGERRPMQVGTALIATIASAVAADRKPLKHAALELLGATAAHDKDLCILALPTFMSSLADYSSPLARAVAIDALQKAFQYARLTLPSNVVDLIVLHLRDTYVVVHKAAVNLFRFWWIPLTDQQRREAFQSLVNIWRVYAGNPNEKFFMDDIADALLVVANGDQEMWQITLRYVCAYLPTAEILVDSKLCATLVRQAQPDASISVLVGRALIGCLARHRRHLYGHGRDWRDDAIDWLSTLPERVWRVVAGDFTACARVVVHRDPGEALLFASALCEHSEHGEEASVLLVAAQAARGHSLFNGLSQPLENLHRQALAGQRAVE